jgi:hypothetical protein
VPGLCPQQQPLSHVQLDLGDPDPEALTALQTQGLELPQLEPRTVEKKSAKLSTCWALKEACVSLLVRTVGKYLGAGPLIPRLREPSAPSLPSLQDGYSHWAPPLLGD